MKHFFTLALFLFTQLLFSQQGYVIPRGCEKLPTVLDCALPVGEDRYNNAYSISENEQSVGYQVINPNILEVRDKGYHGKDVVIAIFDTGIVEHPDLTSPIVRVDYTGDTVTNPDGTLKVHFHGTHVAGILAAIDNEIGVLGVTGSENIMDIRVLGSTGSGSSARIAQAIRDVADGVYEVVPHVMNLSLGSRGKSPEIESSVKYAESKDIAVMCAMGNDGTHGRPESEDLECGSYPARSTIYGGVGAINRANQITSFSSRSQRVMSVGQGYRISSTVLGGGYGDASGTSMACPVEAGKVALLIDIYDLTGQEALKFYYENLTPRLPTYQYGNGYYTFRNVPDRDGMPNDPPVAEPEQPKKKLSKFTLGAIFAGVVLVVGVIAFTQKNRNK